MECEKCRREYLTGFSKRKKMRQKKAAEDKINLQKQLKKEMREKKRSALSDLPSEYEHLKASSTNAFEIGEHDVVVTEFESSAYDKISSVQKLIESNERPPVLKQDDSLKKRIAKNKAVTRQKSIKHRNSGKPSKSRTRNKKGHGKRH